MKSFDEFVKELHTKKIINEYSIRDNKLINKWCTGGMDGGNCYGDEPYSTPGDQKPEFETLDTILEAYFPEIGFLQYKKFIREYVKYSEDTTYEYYGNSSNYALETVSLYDLYDYLVDHNKL